MGDIKACLPTDSRTVTAIYLHHKKVGDAEPPREYLGASSIGHPCDRYLWYSFNDCVTGNIEGRMYRLLETGNLQELRFVKELRAIGVVVHDVDHNGDQWAISDISGHFRGHMDGALLGVLEAPKSWHVFEAKTHSQKSYNLLVKDGVKKSKPMHYAQVQIYMHKTGMKRALYLAVNKNTDELYSERIEYDGRAANSLMKRARRIIEARSAPERCANSADWYECGWCDARDLCWRTTEAALPLPYISCRQCCRSTPTMDSEHGRWHCVKFNATINRERQLQACQDHLLLPDLIRFAKPTDATDDSIEFTNEDGFVWNHGAKAWTTNELMNCTIDSINGVVGKIKEAFSGSEIAYSGQMTDEVVERYADATTIWTGPAKALNRAWDDNYNESLPNQNPTAKQEDKRYLAMEFKGGRAAIINRETQESWILEKK